MTPPADLPFSSEALPRTLGPLRLLNRLGAGGMGSVYAADVERPIASLPAGARIAVKVFRDDAVTGPQGLERLRREASVGKSLDHPAIVRTHDLVTLDDGGIARHVLLMELIEGTTLRRLLDDLGALPEPLLRQIASRLARALAAIHALGFVHRDVKPENVLVGADYQVKLSDLGIARPLDVPGLTTAGAFLGSVAYASPEHFGSGALSPKSDLYSLGVVLHEAACGRPPFNEATIAGLVRRHLEQRPRRLGELVADVSPFLEELVAALLEKDPSRRIESAADLADILAEGEASAWWRLRDGEPAARAPRLPREGATPLVGRDEELAALESAAREALAGEGGALLLVGEAGIGKSRLLEELERRLAVAEEPPVWLAGENPPGGAGSRGAFAESLAERFPESALHRLLERHLASPEAARSLEAWALGAPPPAGTILTRDILHSGLTRLMTGLAATQPLLWLVEDLHFASAEERATFAALARAARGHRVLLVGTARPGLPPEEFAALERVGVRRVPLARLSPRAVVDLLAASLRSQRLAEDLGGRVAARTDGNPYFVLEVVRDLQEKGIMRRGDDGAWAAASRISAIDVPTSVRSLMLERTAALSSDERAVIDAAAVAGFHFEADLVAEVLGSTRLATLQLLAGIERRTGLVRSAGARHHFDHHQLQEVLSEAVPEPLRVEIHALLARALEPRVTAAGNDVELPVRLMKHAVAGGLFDMAERHLGPAFVSLRLRLQNEAAVDLAQLCIERFPAGTVGRAIAGTRLAYVYELMSRSDDAHAMAERALADAEKSGDAAMTGQALHALAMIMSRAGKLDEAEQVAARGRDVARSVNAVLVESKNIATMGTIAANQGRMTIALQRFREAADRFREAGAKGDEAIVLGNLALGLATIGSAEALPLASRSLELAEGVGDLLQAAHAELTLGRLLVDDGEFDESLRRITRGGERARSFNLGRLAATASERTARRHWSAGDPVAARRVADDARAAASPQHDRQMLGRLLMLIAEIDMTEGRFDEARANLVEAAEHERAARSARDLVDVLLSSAACEWLAGDRERAAEHARAAREAAAGIEDPRQRAWSALLLGTEPPQEAEVASQLALPRLETLAVLAARDSGDAAAKARFEEAIAQLAARVSEELRPAFLSRGVARVRAIAGT